jgi:hypothetical protein
MAQPLTDVTRGRRGEAVDDLMCPRIGGGTAEYEWMAWQEIADEARRDTLVVISVGATDLRTPPAGQDLWWRSRACRNFPTRIWRNCSGWFPRSLTGTCLPDRDLAVRLLRPVSSGKTGSATTRRCGIRPMT